MKLAKHIRRLIIVYGYRETIIARPKEVRQSLFCYGVTPSLNQVKCAIRKHTPYILYGKEAFWCHCGNPTPHNRETCERAIEFERTNGRTHYHCPLCEMYGTNYFADANGIVWIEGLAACEFNRRLVEKTERDDAQMRRDMTYAFTPA